MATRVVEGKKPYTGGKAISIDENKVISLNLRDENNLIIYDAGDDEIYVDLQLDDEITPTSAFPIGVNVGRVIVDNGWDKPGTIISAETTSGDNIKIFYADEGTLWIDNGTGTFKQIYFKSDVDALLLALRNYIDGELAKKQNGVSSATAPENPSEGDLWYDTTNSAMKVWDGTAWQSVGTGGGGSDIEYVTQAEYNALLPGALTDNKHYFIYSTSGGGGGWQPGANTIAYYEFNNNLNDSSGNNHNFSGTNTTVTYGTLSGGAKYIHFPSGAWANPQSGMPYNTSSYTINFWVKKGNSDWGDLLDFQVGTSGVNYWNRIGGNTTAMSFVINRSNVTVPDFTSQWRNVVIVNDNNTSSLYIDGVLITSQQTNSYNMNIQYFGLNRPGYAYEPIGRDNYYSEIIIENSKRTAQEISDYFNQTKGDYGIS